MRSKLSRLDKEWREMDRQIAKDSAPCSAYQMRRARNEMNAETTAPSGDCSIDEAIRRVGPICSEAVSSLPAASLLHLSETIYCNALAYQLVAAGFDVAREYAIPVLNDFGLSCGMLYADLVVSSQIRFNGSIIVEVKKFSRDRDYAMRQVATYAEFWKQERGVVATCVVIIEDIVSELGLDRTGWDLESHFAAMRSDALEGE